MSAKRLLIITGPQGSGNHLFSRIFSQHGAVHGWEELKKQYWVPSDQEPFAEYWVQPEKLQKEYFDSSDYFVANVSVPFFYDGVRQFPRIAELARRVQSFGITVVIAVFRIICCCHYTYFCYCPSSWPSFMLCPG